MDYKDELRTIIELYIEEYGSNTFTKHEISDLIDYCHRSLEHHFEKELEIGQNLKKKLDNINKPFADKLLGYLSSDKIPDKVTIDAIDYTENNDKTITGFFKDREGNIKSRPFKIGKLLDS